jgi:hypothetical protein
MEHDESLDDVDVAIRFEAADAETIAQLKALFEDDDVLAPRAFSGAEVVTVIAKLTATTVGKLLDFFVKKGSATPKTSLEIGNHKVAITGLSREDMEKLLASSGFRSAVRAVREK